MTLVNDLERHAGREDRRYKLKPKPRKLTTGPVPVRLLKNAAARLRRYERDIVKMYEALLFYAEPERVGGHWNEDYPGGVSWQCGERVCLDMGEHAKYALRDVTVATKRRIENGLREESADDGGEDEPAGMLGVAQRRGDVDERAA